ncbi:MAG: hypothetical protein JSV88_12840 [Candidatus Aminicenantes bacterium]|nr:MAG: hypothetical protein JSV88_12840 [Candidatus Aminicenantes bacterium]
MILDEEKTHKDFIRNYKKFQEKFDKLYWKKNPDWYLEFKEFKDEKFKPIEEYQGFYYISNHGKVISFKRKLPGVRRSSMLNGFLAVTLNHFGSNKLHFIHELVYSHFVEKLKPYHRVIHKNNDVADNYYKNLQQVSISEILAAKEPGKSDDSVPLQQTKLRKVNKSPGAKDSTKTRKPKRRRSRQPMNELDAGVLQFNKEGKFVRQFPSLREAAQDLEINPQSILNCLKGKTTIAGGYQWRYSVDPNFDEGVFDIEPVPKPKTRFKKPVYQYDPEGNFIKKYPSVKEAAKAMGITPGAISFSMKKSNRTAAGFIWKLKEK